MTWASSFTSHLLPHLSGRRGGAALATSLGRVRLQREKDVKVLQEAGHALHGSRRKGCVYRSRVLLREQTLPPLTVQQAEGPGEAALTQEGLNCPLAPGQTPGAELWQMPSEVT